MQFSDLIKISLSALIANKLRTFLTVLGIVIGVTSVIAIVSIVIGMNSKVTGLINQMGSSTFIISKYGPEDHTSDEAFREARGRKDIRLRDMAAIERGCELCSDVGARTMTRRTIKYRSEKLNSVFIVGATHNILRITDFEIAEGRSHNAFEDERNRQVTIIGDKLKRDFFRNLDPIGKTIKIGGYDYEVIGVARPRGSILGEDLDEFAIIPLTSFLRNFGSHRSIDILVKAESEEVINQAVDQARVIMRARRDVPFANSDNFGVTTADDWLEFYGRVTGTVQIVAVAIPLIALVVAGIVVMNIMMVSVTERTREIGIRKSMGAKRRHILLQFLSEALMMSVFGGALGIGLGILAAKILADQGDLPFIISREAIMGGIFISTGVGIIFGMYPAYKGSRMDPIDAMRFE